MRCPRCDDVRRGRGNRPFAAPRPSRNPTLPAPAESKSRSRRSRSESSRRRDREREPKSAPEPDHDPHRNPPGSLPASVLIGLALLPFAIPILWLIAPAVVGAEAMLSIATPIALALSASVLCLAVIYTVDWTPTTRVKGVLMLVGLAYFAAMGLYFLKKDLVERVQQATGLEERIDWRELKKGNYEVQMPSPVQPVAEKDIPLKSLKLECWTATHNSQHVGWHVFVVGSVELAAVAKGKRWNNADEARVGTDAWFKDIAEEIVKWSGGQLRGDPIKIESMQGRELEIERKESIRLVRFYLIRGSVYYLSAERSKVQRNNEDPARHFFSSFYVPD